MNRKLKLVKEIGRCIKCGRMIYDKDDYVRVTEFISGKQDREQFFHFKCYEEIFNIKKIALGMAARANKIMDMAGLSV